MYSFRLRIQTFVEVDEQDKSPMSVNIHGKKNHANSMHIRGSRAFTNICNESDGNVWSILHESGERGYTPKNDNTVGSTPIDLEILPFDSARYFADIWFVVCCRTKHLNVQP